MLTKNDTLFSFLPYRKHSLWTNALLVTILLTAAVSCKEEEEDKKGSKYVGTYTLSNGEVSFENEKTTFTYDGDVTFENLANIGIINGVEINYSITFSEAEARLDGENDVTISGSTHSIRIDGNVYTDALGDDPKERTFSDNDGVLTISNMPIKSHFQDLANETYPVKEAKVKFTLTKKK